MAKIRSKFDKMPALELVLENAWKNDEKPCLWILKNGGFAWEELHFSRFSVSSNGPKILLKSGSEGSQTRSLKIQ